MKFSSKIEKCGLSPMRKFAPYANEAAKKGKKLYHLNIGQPDLPSPKEGLESLKHIDRKVLEYSPSDGYRSLREKRSEEHTSDSSHRCTSRMPSSA